MLGKLSSIITIVIIAIVYMVIFTALKIMNKDIKSNGKRRTRRKSVGLEIIEPGNSVNLKRGGVIPIQGEITIEEEQTILLFWMTRMFPHYMPKYLLGIMNI